MAVHFLYSSGLSIPSIRLDLSVALHQRLHSAEKVSIVLIMVAEPRISITVVDSREFAEFEVGVVWRRIVVGHLHLLWPRFRVKTRASDIHRRPFCTTSRQLDLSLLDIPLPDGLGTLWCTLKKTRSVDPAIFFSGRCPFCFTLLERHRLLDDSGCSPSPFSGSLFLSRQRSRGPFLTLLGRRGLRLGEILVHYPSRTTGPAQCRTHRRLLAVRARSRLRILLCDFGSEKSSGVWSKPIRTLSRGAGGERRGGRWKRGGGRRRGGTGWEVTGRGEGGRDGGGGPGEQVILEGGKAAGSEGTGGGGSGGGGSGGRGTGRQGTSRGDGSYERGDCAPGMRAPERACGPRRHRRRHFSLSCLSLFCCCLLLFSFSGQ